MAPCAGPTPVAETAVDEPAVADGKPSLVVLPFANLSDDKEQGYLADGITEDLTTELARVPGLFVISRNAAFTYKGKAMQPAQIAKELGVRYILEGSTRRVGDDMRINAQLIDAQTGGQSGPSASTASGPRSSRCRTRSSPDVAGALKLRLVTGQGKARDRRRHQQSRRLRRLSARPRTRTSRHARGYRQGRRAISSRPLRSIPDFGRAAAELAWVYWNADEARLKALGLSWDEIDAKIYEYLAEAAKHPSPTYYQIIAHVADPASTSPMRRSPACRRPWRSIPAIPGPSTD